MIAAPRMVQQVQDQEGKAANHQIWVRREKLVPLDIACYLYFVGLAFSVIFSLLPNHVRLAIRAPVSSVPRSYVAGEPRFCFCHALRRRQDRQQQAIRCRAKWRRRRDLILQISVTIDK